MRRAHRPPLVRPVERAPPGCPGARTGRRGAGPWARLTPTGRAAGRRTPTARASSMATSLATCVLFLRHFTRTRCSLVESLLC